jgi:hypothetical protein
MSPEKPNSEPPALISSTAERLAAIVEAAERAAAKVIDDAEEQARRQIEDANARADRIVAERLRTLADELDPPAARPRPSRLEAVAPDPAPEQAAGGRRSGSAGARLLATQMAVSGSSREEIEQRLRSGFEIEDTSEILDAILGPEE